MRSETQTMGSTKEAGYWVGFDLGGTKMLATVFDGKFRKQGKKRKRTRGYEGFEAGWKRMLQALDGALEDAGGRREQIAGIGVGCPGPVDLEAGVIVDAVNLGWKNVPLQRRLQEEFGCPVVVVNDVDAGVYGESRFGAARGARCVLGVFPGTGIGGGCVYEGQIIRGKRLSCMEFGHLQVTRNGRLCGCGLHGCLETEASRLAISATAAKAAYRGQAPHLLKLVGTNLSDIRSSVLAESIAKGDVAVEQIINRAADFIGIAVANFVHLLAPDVVVLGGGLVEAMPELLVGGVARSAREHVMPGFASSFQVVPAQLGDDACVLGSAAWVARVTGRAKGDDEGELRGSLPADPPTPANAIGERAVSEQPVAGEPGTGSPGGGNAGPAKPGTAEPAAADQAAPDADSEDAASEDAARRAGRGRANRSSKRSTRKSSS